MRGGEGGGVGRGGRYGGAASCLLSQLVGRVLNTFGVPVYQLAPARRRI